MSETTSQPAVGVETPLNDSGDNYDEIVEQLDGEGFAPTSDQDDPDQNTDDEETPEGIPAKDTLKVNGKSIEKTYSEIKEMAQKYSATEMKLETAKKEITEAREMKKNIGAQQDAVKSLLGVLQRGDFVRLEDFVKERLGGSEQFNKAAIQYALKLYEDSKMSPEQREAIENKKMIAKYKADAEERQKQEQERSFEFKVNEWNQHLATEVPKALKTVGLPDSEFVREHVISTWRAAIERGQNPTATAVVAFVKKKLEDSKIVNFGQPKSTPQRPRATSESVGNRQAAQKETGYQSWDHWIKTRGR